MHEHIHLAIAHASQERAPHALHEHLQKVAILAQGFCSAPQFAKWAYLAGIWHDLGKYRPGFQRYIRQVTGFDAHIEDDISGKTPHAAAGAMHAVEVLGQYPGGKIKGRLLAYLISGHHAGLPDWDSSEAGLPAKLARISEYEDARSGIYSIPPEIFDPHLDPEWPWAKESSTEDPSAWLHIWLRFLFSALVDADFLDTEAYLNPAQAALRSNYSSLSELAILYDAFMATKRSLDSSVNRLRTEILDACLCGATQNPGIFTLTVPTGGGKTLASTGFAIKHAHTHKKQRIIYVIPYTSIIEQTAEVLASIFGRENIIEHHSNLDVSRETPQSRIACENWDAPIIVTTSVQFFESFFANRTSRCRKLHNVIDSVVIFDEVQLLPAEFLAPIQNLLSALTTRFGVSAVLCSATQPVLDKPQIGSTGKTLLPALPNVRELIPDVARLYWELKRVNVEWPTSDAPRQWPDLADELSAMPQVLCIVSRRDDARDLARLMPSDTIHLSALMCAEHRSQVIALIKARLMAGECVRVVSTQLVEAGVDLDFPVVFRAFAGFDSIAQAAGRCNREGKRQQPGRVVVFHTEKLPPRGHLRHCYQTARSLQFQSKPDFDDPASFRQYFTHLFASKDTFDTKGICALLENRASEQEPDAFTKIRFKEAAKRFSLIDDADQCQVMVLFGDSSKHLDVLRQYGPNRTLLRALQRFSVSVPQRQLRALIERGDVSEIAQLPGVYAQTADGLYHARFGLQLEYPEYDPAMLTLTE